jgi:hypothetical protein
MEEYGANQRRRARLKPRRLAWQGKAFEKKPGYQF